MTALAFAAGVITASAFMAVAQEIAAVNTNGVLAGYIVQDSAGREICRDPSVWLHFRGPDSYIVCD